MINRMTFLIFQDFNANNDIDREVTFSLQDTYLKNYLESIKDKRSIENFIENCSNDESKAVYEYAVQKCCISEEECYYSEAFTKEYEYFSQNLKLLKIRAKITPDDYYKRVYTAKLRKTSA